jgi:hypothetical protein
LQVAFDTAIDVAGRMGGGRVMVDKYSNAEWVRQAVDALPEEAYRIGAVEKPFGARPVEAIVKHWLGIDAVPVRSEIQHVDPGLMDQGLQDGYKQAGLLLGTPRSCRLALRGP